MKRARLFLLIPIISYHWMGAASPNGNYKGLKWEDYLPAISWVESRGKQYSVSYLGSHAGRGQYHVSEICFEHWKWYHMDHWVVKQGLGPDCLFNTNVCREVALWFLLWLDKYYDGRKDKIRLVLSGYNQGAAHTDQYGISTQYVERIYQYMREHQ